jgi:hypothetical protein
MTMNRMISAMALRQRTRVLLLENEGAVTKEACPCCRAQSTLLAMPSTLVGRVVTFSESRVVS